MDGSWLEVIWGVWIYKLILLIFAPLLTRTKLCYSLRYSKSETTLLFLHVGCHDVAVCKQMWWHLLTSQHPQQRWNDKWINYNQEMKTLCIKIVHCKWLYASSRSLKFQQLKFPVTEPLNIKPGMFVFNPAIFWLEVASTLNLSCHARQGTWGCLRDISEISWGRRDLMLTWTQTKTYLAWDCEHKLNYTQTKWNQGWEKMRIHCKWHNTASDTTLQVRLHSLMIAPAHDGTTPWWDQPSLPLSLSPSSTDFNS